MFIRLPALCPRPSLQNPPPPKGTNSWAQPECRERKSARVSVRPPAGSISSTPTLPSRAMHLQFPVASEVVVQEPAGIRQAPMDINKPRQRASKQASERERERERETNAQRANIQRETRAKRRSVRERNTTGVVTLQAARNRSLIAKRQNSKKWASPERWGKSRGSVTKTERLQYE